MSHLEGSCMARLGSMLRSASQPEFLYEHRQLRSAALRAVQHSSAGLGSGLGPIMAGLHASRPAWVILQNAVFWTSEAREESSRAAVAVAVANTTAAKASSAREWTEGLAILVA